MGATVVAAATLAVTGCGPVLDLEESASDTESGSSGSETDTSIRPLETDSVSETTPSTTVTPGCENSSDCPAGFFCENNECIEEYDCSYDDYGCYCVYGHCSPGYECYGDDDCGEGSLCGEGGYGYCEYLQGIPECDEELLVQTTPIALDQDVGIASLSFVDTDGDGDDELIVGTEEGGVVFSAGGEPPVQLDALAVPVVDATGGDFDGDGVPDLAIAYPDRVWIGYGFGTAGASEVLYTTGTPGIVQLSALQWDEGAPDDLAMLDDQGVLRLARGDAQRVIDFNVVDPDQVFPARQLVAIDYDAEAFDDIVLESLVGAQPQRYQFSGQYDPLGAPPREGRFRNISSGSMGGSERSDVIWTTRFDGWVYLEGLTDGETWTERALYTAHDEPDTGDLDGDGFDDLVLVGSDGFTVVKGDARWLMGCSATAALEASGPDPLLAVGDFDGDGRHEVAVTTADAAVSLFAVSF